MIEKLPFRIKIVRTDNGHEFQTRFHWHLLDLNINTKLHEWGNFCNLLWFPSSYCGFTPYEELRAKLDNNIQSQT